jgi:hypothetical protein
MLCVWLFVARVPEPPIIVDGLRMTLTFRSALQLGIVLSEGASAPLHDHRLRHQCYHAMEITVKEPISSAINFCIQQKILRLWYLDEGVKGLQPADGFASSTLYLTATASKSSDTPDL